MSGSPWLPSHAYTRGTKNLFGNSEYVGMDFPVSLYENLLVSLFSLPSGAEQTPLQSPAQRPPLISAPAATLQRPT